MGRKKKKEESGGVPLWLITFTDLMTLMLTFFVLLVSMAKVDERRKLVVLGSIFGTFGFGHHGYDVLSTKDTRRTVSSGAFELEDNLEPIKPLLWEYAEEDLKFESSRFVQVLSIGADVLFEPDSLTISADGRHILRTVIPVLKNVTSPLLLAGHTSTLRDELGEDYRVADKDLNPDVSWRISLGRVLSVYRFLVAGGIKPEMLKIEAFGKFRPHYPNSTPKGRRSNRRVDIVLDKRSVKVEKELKKIVPDVKGKQKSDEFDYKGFVFPVEESEQPPASPGN
jgi:chemotaxis protein MotB